MTPPYPRCATRSIRRRTLRTEPPCPYRARRDRPCSSRRAGARTLASIRASPTARNMIATGTRKAIHTLLVPPSARRSPPNRAWITPSVMPVSPLPADQPVSDESGKALLLPFRARAAGRYRGATRRSPRSLRRPRTGSRTSRQRAHRRGAGRRPTFGQRLNLGFASSVAALGSISSRSDCSVWRRTYRRGLQDVSRKADDGHGGQGKPAPRAGMFDRAAAGRCSGRRCYQHSPEVRRPGLGRVVPAKFLVQLRAEHQQRRTRTSVDRKRLIGNSESLIKLAVPCGNDCKGEPRLGSPHR